MEENEVERTSYKARRKSRKVSWMVEIPADDYGRLQKFHCRLYVVGRSETLY